MSGFWSRLRRAGIEPFDDAETRLNKQLLMLATGLVSLATALWLAIYWWLGPRFSATWPYLFQLALAANVVLYIATRNFAFFRISQLTLLLFAPFAIQLSIGNFHEASGIILWGLLAPIGAILFFGVRQSLPWFFAWAFLVALAAGFDYLQADAVVTSANRVPPRTSMVFFALNFITVASMVYLLLQYAISEKKKVQTRLEEAHRRLEEEQQRSETLLYNVLPPPISLRLKESPTAVIADRIEEVSVMFADIVDFTRLASHLPPQEVFGLLNRIFSVFDDLTSRYGLERIKTIGDAYMVAGGLFEPCADHLRAMAEMALAMQKVLHDFSLNTARLEMRIGIACGPVLAGVIGKRKFIYDLWGDTVNLASRLCSEAHPSEILCDTASRQRLQHAFLFAPARTVPLKGMGEVTVYPLLESPASANPDHCRSTSSACVRS